MLQLLQVVTEGKTAAAGRRVTGNHQATHNEMPAQIYGEAFPHAPAFRAQILSPRTKAAAPGHTHSSLSCAMGGKYLHWS